MSLFRELSYENAITPVRSIQFALLSPDEILRRSVMEVRTTETFNGNLEVANGLFDQRMGVVEHGRFCQTCRQGYTFCPGHMGHIRLAVPVFHVHFFNSIVINLLKCVCFRCSRLLISPDDPAMLAIAKRHHRQKRWEAVYRLISKNGSIRRCGQANPGGCGALQPVRTCKHSDKFLKIESYRREMHFGGGGGGDEEGRQGKDDAGGEPKPVKVVLGAEEVHAILSRIPDRDVVALGFHPQYSRPEWMVATVLPIPPPAVRPSAKNDMGQRSEDDLTTVLRNIIKTNNALKAKIAAGKSVDGDPQVQLLQYYVATMVDNQIPNVSPATQRTGRNIKSISERLKTKEGRIRGNLLGKRVDYSARSVITPDPNISVTELGVPLRVAMNLTFPETVTPHNRDRLLAAARNGPAAYPGARFLQKRDGAGGQLRTIQLRAHKDPPAIADGDVVHRHMADGDYVLFNRQPSLHKMSMMAHRVRVMPYDTFRLNACVTPCFNADFDGDEMNLHSAISAFSMTEIALLAAVAIHPISPKNGRPIVAVVQDVALGVHLITLPDVAIGPRLLHNLMASLPRFDGHLPPGPVWTGKQALSAVIPPGVNIHTRSGGGVALVRMGAIDPASAPFSKSVYQAGSTGLVHTVYNKLGPRAMTDLLDGTQRLVCDYLLQAGFSVGLADIIAAPDAARDIRAEIDRIVDEVRAQVAGLHDGAWRPIPAAALATRADAFEFEVNRRLNGAVSAASAVIDRNLSPANRMARMVTAGSKGSPLNIVQMTATLGQQNVDQKRPAYGFQGRTLPHFCKYDDGPEARGFVSSSFARGLRPAEFLFHSMGGRVGLIDTAVRTSDSGYISRKLVKAMEDCKVAADGTVRNALGQLVQILYGEDGMDPVAVEQQKLFNLDFDGDRMADEHLLAPGDPLLDAALTPAARDAWHADPQWHRFRDHFRDLMDDRTAVVQRMFGGKKNVATDKGVEFPVHLHRIVHDALETQRLTAPRGWPSDLDPRAALDHIDALLRDLRPHPAMPQSPLFAALLRSHLCPKRLLAEGMFADTLAHVVDQVRERYEASLAQPGDMVGVVSAQSLGEPMTQLTLDTFHTAGVASGSKAVSGLPRVLELLNVTSNPKQPLIHVHLPPDVRYDRAAVARVKARLETTRLADVVIASRIYYDPLDWDTRVPEDRALVEAFRVLQPPLAAAPAANPWVIRFRVDRALLVDHDLTMLDVAEGIKQFYRDTVSAVYSDDNADDLVFRLRLEPSAAAAGGDLLAEVKALEAAMMDAVTLKGNLGINTAAPLNPIGVKDHHFDPATGAFTRVSDLDEYVLETDGRDLVEVLASPWVDPVRTQSNDACETLRVLGVEAARAKMFRELLEVLKETNINPRHILLLVDAMTMGGGLQSVNRHGINRGDIGPLAKCSFEEMSDMLTKAAAFADVDRVNGVSASIMLGQVAPGGTGEVEPRLDETLMSDTVVAPAAHPAPADRQPPAAALDRDDMCRRILRFEPIDMTVDDGWTAPPPPLAITVA